MLTEREMDTKVCSKCREVKLLEEFNKRKDKKDGYRSECKACNKEYAAKHYAANPEKIKERSAKYYAANPEKEKERNAKYYAANPEKRKESQSKWRAANREKERERVAKYRAANPDYQAKWCAANPDYQAKWCAANPHKGRARASKRRAAKRRAIPKWLTEKDWQAMDDINEEADRLTRETGVKYEVDHIHPLQGKLICGLQCPANLQILTAAENRSKSNKFKPYVQDSM